MASSLFAIFMIYICYRKEQICIKQSLQLNVNEKRLPTLHLQGGHSDFLKIKFYTPKATFLLGF